MWSQVQSISASKQEVIKQMYGNDIEITGSWLAKVEKYKPYKGKEFTSHQLKWNNSYIKALSGGQERRFLVFNLLELKIINLVNPPAFVDVEMRDLLKDETFYIKDIRKQVPLINIYSLNDVTVCLEKEVYRGRTYYVGEIEISK